MKVAVCVKAVPDTLAGRRLDPASGRLDRSGELALSRLRPPRASRRRSRMREQLGGRGRRRLARTARPRPTRCARRSRWAPTAPCSSATRAFAGADLLVSAAALAGGAPARGARPRALRPAVLRRRGRLPLGGGRRAPRAAVHLPGRRAQRRGGQPERPPPDRVRLRAHRGAAAGGRRRLATRSTSRATPR